MMERVSTCSSVPSGTIAVMVGCDAYAQPRFPLQHHSPRAVADDVELDFQAASPASLRK